MTVSYDFMRIFNPKTGFFDFHFLSFSIPFLDILIGYIFMKGLTQCFLSFLDEKHL